MNIDFELYKIFDVVAKNKNITKASEELHISQPAISKSIKKLEEQLGGQLFVRTKRGVILTSEGKEFYEYIKHAMEYITNAENKFTEMINLESGNIKIGINTTLAKTFFLPYLEEFHKLYPKINIQIITGQANDLLQKLSNGLIDIVIFNIGSEKYTNDIEVIKCKEVKDCFVANSSFDFLKDKLISIKDLNNYSLILQSKGSNTRECLDLFAEKNNISFKPNIEMASYSLVIELTKIGLGIGYVVEENVINELKNNELFKLNIKEEIPSRYIGMAISKKHIPNFSTKKLIEIVNKKMV